MDRKTEGQTLCDYKGMLSSRVASLLDKLSYSLSLSADVTIIGKQAANGQCMSLTTSWSS